MGGTPKSTGTARYFLCRLGPVPLCWTCGNIYHNEQDCFCGRMPSICKHHNIQFDPLPRPEYCQSWEKCQTRHGAADDGLAGGPSDDLLLFDSQEQYGDFKKCYTHNGMWSAAGCSFDISTFPAVDDAIFSVGRFGNAGSTDLAMSSRVFSANIGRRSMHRKSYPATSMTAVYGLTVAGLLITLAWLLQRVLLHRSKNSADIEDSNSIVDYRHEKDKVVEESMGVKSFE